MLRSTFGHTLAEIDARLFVGRRSELDLFRSWLQTDAADIGLLYIWGPGGSGKSALLGAFSRLGKAEGRDVVLIDGRDVQPTPDALAYALGGATLEAAIAGLNASGALVLMDTFERLADLTRVVGQQLLPRLGAGVRVVVASRQPPGLAWERWRPLMREIRLSPLSRLESTEFLNRRGIHDARLLEQLLRAARGLPLALSLVADLVLQLGVRDLRAATDWQRLLRSLVDQLLEDVTDPIERELLEVGAVVRQFDEPLLAEVARRADVGAAFGSLCQLSIVQPGSHGLLLHDDVREILAQDLRWRQPRRFAELRLRALAYYRARALSATAAEREWLVGERMALWENAFVQALLFTEAEDGRVWLDWGRPEDRDELVAVWNDWIDNWLSKQMPLHLDRAADLETLYATLAYRGTRTRVARDRDNRIVGFSTAMPMCRESVSAARRHPGLRAIIDAYMQRLGSRLPDQPEDSNTYFFYNLAHTQEDERVTQQALIRDVFGLFARGGVYLVATPLPTYKNLFRSLGFQRLPGAESSFWSPQEPEEGFILDLSSLGVERWIEAIVAGQAPPRSLTADEIKRALQQEILPHWHTDANLSRSLLADELTAGNHPDAAATAVRTRVLNALDQLRAHGGDRADLAARALAATYFEKRTSPDAVAARLAVSRSTLYRLLHRAVRQLAEALQAAGPSSL